MFGKEKKAEDKKKETALKREENRKKSGVKHKKPKQKQAGNGNLSCLFGLGSAAVLAGCIAYAFVRRGEAPGIIGGIPNFSNIDAALLITFRSESLPITIPTFGTLFPP